MSMEDVKGMYLAAGSRFIAYPALLPGSSCVDDDVFWRDDFWNVFDCSIWGIL